MNEIERAIRNSPLKKKEIAGLIGVSVPTLWKYAKGLLHPRPRKAKEISRVLGIPFERVYALEDANPPCGAGKRRGQACLVKSSKPSC